MTAQSKALTLKLFGPFEVRKHGVPLAGLHNREGERLLVLLTLQAGRVVPNTALASLLWPETGSLDSLRQSVSHLRQCLGEEGARLQAPKGGLLLDLSEADVDVLAFDQATRQGDVASQQHLISLYRGPLLHEWEERHAEDRTWALKERAQRRDKYREALKTLAKAYVNSGDNELASTYLQQYLAGNPSDEWAWSEWMNVLAKAGQRVAAMNLYQKCHDLFQQKHGLAPPAEMSRLYHQLRQGQAPEEQAAPTEDPFLSEPVGGAVPLRSPYYISRPADTALQNALTRRDSIVLLKGPRQTGKTSLLARGLQQAREQDARVAFTDFQKISPEHWAGMETFYRAVAQNLADQLELDVAIEEVWSEKRGANENFERFLKREILQKSSAAVVWGLDEADRLFNYPYCNDVFALFRSWHNERSLNPYGPWNKLTMAMSYASEAHLFITDLNQSPFNVGTRLTLEDFTPAQVEELNHLYGAPLHNADESQRFYTLVGGNPFLVRAGLREMIMQHTDFAALEGAADKGEGVFRAHLQRLWHALSQSGELVEAVRGLIQGRPCPTQDSFYRLRSAGLLTGLDPANAAFRCKLYQTYLQTRLA